MQDNQCEYCHGAIQAKKVTVPYRYKGKLVIIEHVPVGVCRRCGERYYEARTVERMEAIAKRRQAATKSIVVPIRNFTEAAA